MGQEDDALVPAQHNRDIIQAASPPPVDQKYLTKEELKFNAAGEFVLWKKFYDINGTLEEYDKRIVHQSLDEVVVETVTVYPWVKTL